MIPSSKKPFISPIFGLALGILASSTASILIRFAQVYAPSLLIAAYRLAIAALILAPLAYLRYRKELSSLNQQDLILALLSGLFLAIHFATWISSLAYTTVASSVVLVSTSPLWVALLSPFTIRERISRPVLIGMGMALIGGIIVGLSDSCQLASGHLVCPSFSEFIRGQAFLGDLLALTGGLMAAAYLLIGRRLRGSVPLVPYIFVVYGMAAVVMILVVLGAKQNPVGYPPVAYLWFLLLALVPQLLGHSSFNWALRYLTAAYVSISLLGEPIGSTILAYFLLHETPTVFKLIGAILILAGIYVASKSETKTVSEAGERVPSEKGAQDA